MKSIKKKIAILVNSQRNDDDLEKFLVNKINDLGGEVVSPQDPYDVMNPAFLDEFFRNLAYDCFCVIVLGGDGTILSVAAQTSVYNIPLFGINCGHIGFLSEADKSIDFEEILGRLFLGDYIRENRMMLEVEVIRNNEVFLHHHCLNDCVITKSSFDGLVDFEATVNKKPAISFSGDGLICATPTGASGYSLSAGGPLVSPDMEAVILTPVSAHCLYTRPLVMSATDEIEVTAFRPDGECILSIDGRTASVTLKKGDIIHISKSELVTTFIRLNNKSFFHVLNEKLRERR